MAKESPVGSHQHPKLELPSCSFSACSSFNLGYLLSPADPSRWEGASSNAIFGLDIGGTLCKVVYFEPLHNVETTPGTGAKAYLSVSEGATSTISCQKDDKATVEGVVDDAWQLKRDSFSRQPDPELNGKWSFLDRNVIHSNFGNDRPVNEEEARTKVKSLNEVHKLWTSSHNPVFLPGRGTLYFKCFETWMMQEFLLLSKEHSLISGDRALGATGGGARKFKNEFFQIAGLKLNHADELRSLVRGIDFLMRHAQHESVEYPKGSFQGGAIQRPFRTTDNSGSDSNLDFRYGAEVDDDNLGPKEPEMNSRTLEGPSESGMSIEGNGNIYPYLVVNIGSGVSILLVESPDQFRRVGGTSLGGSTFFGLASILTGCESFEEAIELATVGDSTEIDMLVGDIYGGDYSEMGLAATTVASSFGKLVHPSKRALAMNAPQHLAKATLLMITNNIGSLAKLHAQSTGVEYVLFTGSFMHGNKLAMRLLAVAMEFWSRGQIKAMFLRHEGHAGAMGALLSALDSTNPSDALLA